MITENNTTELGEWLEHGGMQGAGMLPGEQSWASLKCGGGPHEGEMDESHPLLLGRVMIQGSYESETL